MIAHLRRIPPTWLACLLALVAYGLAAGPTLTRQSIAPHYVYLADALLHGRLDVRQPPSSYDMLLVDGRAYVAQSPMPATVLMPFVALFGVGFSDILFGVVLGALNVALVHGMFKRWPLTLLFAFGTPHLYLAALGSTWFNAHVVAVFFGLMAVQAATTVFPNRAGGLRQPPGDQSPGYEKKNPLKGVIGPIHRANWFLSGLWLACAGFARPTMLFGSAFLFVLIWLTHAGRDRLRPLAAVAAAIGLGVAAHGLYNAARFGSPTDFGYQYDAGAPNITSAYTRYGGFNPRFLPCNLFVAFFNPPEVNGYVPPITYEVCGYLLEGVNLSDTSAPVTPNPLGMSLLLTTPAFLLLIAARGRDPLTVAAWAGLLATMIPLWMYHNTGSLQFGYRYWLDAAPMWLLLLAGVFAKPLRRFQTFARVLIGASIAINVWGWLWMFEKFVGAT
jgi:hypothetical protein